MVYVSSCGDEVENLRQELTPCFALGVASHHPVLGGRRRWLGEGSGCVKAFRRQKRRKA
jgi:hypothetical protein